MYHPKYEAEGLIGGKILKLSADVHFAGEDLCVIVTGGDAPHIGSVSISQPRASLKKPDKISATTSTYNFMGHMDDRIGNLIAQELAAGLNRKTVVLCGIHVDEICPEELDLILNLGKELLEKLKQI